MSGKNRSVLFNLNGDNWMNKPLGAFLMPLLILVNNLIILVSVKIEQEENKRRRIEAVIGSIIAIVSTLMLSVHVYIIAYNLGYEISVTSFATITSGVVFILVGNLIPRLPQGSMQCQNFPNPRYVRYLVFKGDLC